MWGRVCVAISVSGECSGLVCGVIVLCCVWWVGGDGSRKREPKGSKDYVSQGHFCQRPAFTATMQCPAHTRGIRQFDREQPRNQVSYTVCMV